MMHTTTKPIRILILGLSVVIVATGWGCAGEDKKVGNIMATVVCDPPACGYTGTVTVVAFAGCNIDSQYAYTSSSPLTLTSSDLHTATIANVPAGLVCIVAWNDITGNYALDAGDPYSDLMDTTLEEDFILAPTMHLNSVL